MTRSRPITFLTTAAAVPLVALVVAGCGGGGGGGGATAATPPTNSAGQTATVGVANNGGLGKILVDSQGRTLYLFQADKGTKSACTGACAKAWPPLRASGKPVVGTGLTASKVTTAPRSDGMPQVVYNGHPLYTFAHDQNPGDANGQGVNAFGANWYVLSPAGATITTSASSSSSGSGSGGGGGGY
jgi:predicted lipoprotein with Yx(FWY)xxD motif